MLANLGIPAATPAGATAPERHAAFLADKLCLAAAALAVAPLFLAMRGAPTPAESLLFAAMLTPGAAALVVARAGRLVLAHAVAAAGLAAIALVLFCGLRAGAGTAMTWLTAAGLEA
ncbi:MAG: hypothetical protein INR64_19265, partial [Caulobacteraceae bacterium]|nr:hypothetical protein [Caulobacter sp.]